MKSKIVAAVISAAFLEKLDSFCLEVLGIRDSSRVKFVTSTFLYS